MNNVQLNDDVLGLIVFKSDLHNPSSSLASWKDDSSACSWNRVQCNPAIGRVTEINLVGLGLSGRIGKGLEKLQHLMPSYPRTPSIRKGWVFHQVVMLIIFTRLMGFIIEQYINPIVQNSQHPLKGNLLYAIERVLKLSVPNLYVWLCMFYCFFHLWLNILAELLRFGDCEFYKDWWNAKTVDEYWRLGNMEVLCS